MNLIEMNYSFFGNGFGINTNIIETNIINLAIVITVVIIFVGDALRELLENRKKLILQNICAADARAKEVQDKLNKAVLQLENAKIKAIEINEQGIKTAQREKDLCIKQTEEETNRLKQKKQSAINLQQQKAIKQISQQIVLLSLKQVRDQLKLKMKSKNFHLWVNKVKINKYTSIKKYSNTLI